MARFGTAQIIDTARFGQKKVFEYGIDRMKDEFQVYLDVHNKRMVDLMARFVQKTSAEKRFHIGGGVMTAQMAPVERQYGVTPPQMVDIGGYDAGVRLDAHQNAQAWEAMYLARQTVDSMNDQLNALIAADRRAVVKRMLVSMFDPTQYTVQDRYADNEIIPIYPLLNGDNQPIPRGQYDQVFQNGHNHFMVVATIEPVGVKAAVLNLTEHIDSGSVKIEIAYTDQPAWRALTGFYGTRDSRIISSMFATQGKQLGLMPEANLTDPYNCFIGVIELLNVEIWVRPYVPTGYAILYAEGSNLELPLRGRSSDIPEIEPAELTAIDRSEYNPQIAGRVYRRTWGCSVKERRNGVILRTDNTLSAYVPPTGYAKSDLNLNF